MSLWRVVGWFVDRIEERKAVHRYWAMVGSEQRRSERDARARFMERMGRNRSREERLAGLRDNAVNAPTIERGDGK